LTHRASASALSLSLAFPSGSTSTVRLGLAAASMMLALMIAPRALFTFSPRRASFSLISVSSAAPRSNSQNTRKSSRTFNACSSAASDR